MGPREAKGYVVSRPICRINHARLGPVGWPTGDEMHVLPAFRGSKEDEHQQFFGDFVESMFDSRLDEHQIARTHRLILASHFHPRFASEDIIEFVFCVG